VVVQTQNVKMNGKSMSQAPNHISIWTIFERPTDYPNHFVVRESRVEGEKVVVSPVCQLADSLEAARALIPFGLARLDGRGDPEAIHAVESWI
jgi:hypothetical protein